MDIQSTKISADLLFLPNSELNFGKKIRSYILDNHQTEYSFFARCPMDVLDVDVYELPSGELHVAEISLFPPRRFLFLKEKDDSILHSHVITIDFNDGVVYASMSCRFVLG
jgi:hypothetical protein